MVNLFQFHDNCARRVYSSSKEPTSPLLVSRDSLDGVRSRWKYVNSEKWNRAGERICNSWQIFHVDGVGSDGGKRKRRNKARQRHTEREACQAVRKIRGWKQSGEMNGAFRVTLAKKRLSPLARADLAAGTALVKISTRTTCSGVRLFRWFRPPPARSVCLAE